MALTFLNAERERWQLARGGSNGAGGGAAVPAAPQLTSENSGERWLGELAGLLQRAACAVKKPVGDTGQIAVALQQDGAAAFSDFESLTVAEAQEIWPALGRLDAAVVSTFLVLSKQSAPSSNRPGVRRAEAGPPADQQLEGSLRASTPPHPLVSEPDKQSAIAALRLVVAARRSGIVPPPLVLAHAIRVLHKAQAAPVEVSDQAPAAAAREVLRGAVPNAAFAERACWMEFQGWRKSALGYASAVSLWGQAAAAVKAAPWPPQQCTLDCFASLFRSGASLAQYLSRLRTVLAWLKSPPAAVADTGRLVRGAEKATGPEARKLKLRASPNDTRLLAKWVSDSAERPDIAVSWVVSRHFTLRYSETLLIGTSLAPVKARTTKGKRLSSSLSCAGSVIKNQ